MQAQKKNNLYGIILLTIGSIIWGSSFVAQSTGAEHVGAFTFISLRSFLGSLALIPVILIMDNFKKKKNPEFSKPTKAENKYLLKSGILCGVILTIATSLQQIGITEGTAPGKAGFITSFYMLLVPIFSIALKKKVRPLIWLCATTALIGLYFLCVTDDLSVHMSDIIMFGCSVAFTFHIMVIDHVSPKVDGVRLSCIQFLVAGILAGIPMILTETLTVADLKAAAVSIAYAGIMSSGVAYTLQILAQQKIDPTIASMLMSLESVFAVLTEIIVLGSVPTMRESLGCVIIFAAIIVSQIPQKVKASASTLKGA